MHHLQKTILLKLAHLETARFADLKPKGLDSNVFTYHLKQLINSKLVEKQSGGDYCITQKGKLAVINVRLDSKSELEQAHPVLYLTAQNDKGEWLLRKRLVHPAYGKIGFLHIEPNAHEDIFVTARRMFKQRTGLDAEFRVRGSGFLKILRNDELESYTQFTLLQADSFDGVLNSPGESGHNIWYSGNFKEPEMFPNMPEIMNTLMSSDKIFFLNLTNSL